MPRRGNRSEGEPFRVTLSRQSIEVLEQLASLGVYGRNAAEVGGRFIDQAIERFVEVPRFALGAARVRLIRKRRGRVGKD